MKKFLSIVIGFLLLVSVPVFAFEASDIVYNNEKIMYDIDNAVWHDSIVKPEKKKQFVDIDELDSALEQNVDEDDIVEPNVVVLTKKMSSNIYKTTSLMYDNKQLAIVLTSNFEFLKDGKLIAVDNNNLKYYQVVYEDEHFVQVPLSVEELKMLFPKAQIVKISELQQNKLIVSRPFFKAKKILLVNDTDRQFFKYSYKHPRVQFSDIKGLIKSYKYETIKFSHYGEDEGALTIVITR